MHVNDYVAVLCSLKVLIVDRAVGPSPTKKSTATPRRAESERSGLESVIMEKCGRMSAAA